MIMTDSVPAHGRAARVRLTVRMMLRAATPGNRVPASAG
jgi:hypothetical protein